MYLYLCILIIGCSNADIVSYTKSTLDNGLNYIKYFDRIGYQMCATECDRLNDCYSIVFEYKNLRCFLYDVNCDNAIVKYSEYTILGCYKQKPSGNGSCKALETMVPLSSNMSHCIQTECTTEEVRNAVLSKREFDPTVNWFSCKTGYTNSGSNKATCKPGGKLTTDMRCYLTDVEEPNPGNYGDCVKFPSYVSDWVTIQAQSSNSEKYIVHNCQADPIKVEVQVRSRDPSPYSDYVFNGISSGIRDDDTSKEYGGVVFMYNATHVRLIAPHARSGTSNGAAIYSGNINWYGPYKRFESSADVRVKVWCAKDVNTPTFESAWKQINATATRFHEIHHNLDEEIQLITVQIKLGTTSWIGEGMGSSSVMNLGNYGGVLYGYSNNSLRIWLPVTGRVLDLHDGWGLPSSPDKTFSTGYLKFRIWTKSTINNVMKKLPIGANNNVNITTLPESINQDKDFVYVSTFVDSGNNQGFSFPADSSVQESYAGSTFGSVVYALTPSHLYIWQPIYTNGGAGYLVYIDGNWATTSYQQYSNAGTLQISIIKTVDHC